MTVNWKQMHKTYAISLFAKSKCSESLDYMDQCFKLFWGVKGNKEA